MKRRRGRRGWIMVEMIAVISYVGALLTLTAVVLLNVSAHDRRSLIANETHRLLQTVLTPANYDTCVPLSNSTTPPNACYDVTATLIANDDLNTTYHDDDKVPVLYRMDGPYPASRVSENRNPRDYFVFSPPPDRSGADVCQSELSNGDRLSLYTRRDAAVAGIIQSGIGRGTDSIVRTGATQTPYFSNEEMSWFGVPVPNATPSDVFADTRTGRLTVRFERIDTDPSSTLYGTRLPITQSSPAFEYWADHPGPDGCFVIVVPYNSAVIYQDHNNMQRLCVMTQRGANRRCV